MPDVGDRRKTLGSGPPLRVYRSKQRGQRGLHRIPNQVGPKVRILVQIDISGCRNLRPRQIPTPLLERRINSSRGFRNDLKTADDRKDAHRIAPELLMGPSAYELRARWI